MRSIVVIGSLLLGAVVALGQSAAGPEHPTGAYQCSRGKAAYAAWMAAKGGWGTALVRDTLADQTDVLHYDLSLEVDFVTEWLTGSNLMTVRSRVAGLSVFRFQLSEEYTIPEVRVDDVPATWVRLDPINVEVTLPTLYDVDDEFSVYVAYTGAAVPAVGGRGIDFMVHDGVKEVWTHGCPYFSHTWWPCKDDNADKATADLAFIVPETMVVASNGLLQDVQTVGVNQKRYAWKTEYPTSPYLISLCATNYVMYEPTWQYDGWTMPLQYFIYPEDNTGNVRQQLDLVSEMLTVYSDIFGLYPFINEKYGICEWRWSGGMEHQTITAQGSMVSQDLTVHELAHMWWGDSVTCATWHDVWLNEGFASYAEALWYEFRAGGGEAALHQNMVSQRPQSAIGSVYVYDISDPRNVFDSDLTYSKAAWVLHALRHVVGEQGFWDIVAAWRAAYEGAAATTEDFERLCEDTTGRDLAWFFDEWVYQGKMPRYYYGWYDHVVDGQHYLEVYVRQDPLSVFVMPIDFVITTESGTVTRAVWSDTYKEHHLIPLGSEVPTAVAFDPAPWFLRRDASATSFVAGPPKIVTLDPAPEAVVVASDLAQIVVGFHKDVVIAANDVQLVGQHGGVIPLTVTYDGVRQVATLTPAAALSPDWYTLTVFDSIVDVASGQALDGELTKVWFPEALPSGDGKPGGATVSRFLLAAPGSGDTNCDGSFGSGDVTAFVLALLSGPDAYNAVYPDCDYMTADVNGDNVVNFADINAFVALISR